MIIPLAKITIIGLSRDKEQVLSELQEIGCLHVVSLRPGEEMQKAGAPPSESREALKFLVSCPQFRRQVHNPSKFDAAIVERRALDLKRAIHKLTDERDFLQKRIKDLRPWGDFTFPDPQQVRNLLLWFYIVPNHLKKKVDALDLVYDIVGQDNRFFYIVVVSEDEPEGMPVPRTHTGNKSLSELEQRIEEVELELEDLQAERASLTRWCSLFARNLYFLEDRAELWGVSQQTLDQDSFFALRAWAPREKLQELENLAVDHSLVIEVTEPQPDEIPPTLLQNEALLSSGQDLVSFYMTPSYWLWDPSAIVFFSFALFFGIILGDAGYGVLFAVVLALTWKPMGSSRLGRRLRILFAGLAASTIVCGILLGNYFGIVLSKSSLLSRLRVLDLDNYSAMMRLTILIGCAHLILANTAYAWHRRRSVAALASVGWVMLFIGAISVWLGSSGIGPPFPMMRGGYILMALGACAVLFFTSTEGGFAKRLLGGFHGLTRVSAAFGDTLSYLRLFALLLATASLATTFNGLAQQVSQAFAGFGILFAAIILLIGHSLNILLGITGGFIHGLRLNFIEFFNWATPDEGYPFRPFARKEKSKWTN